MKLLPPREVEHTQHASHAAETSRISAIRSELSRGERELNDWKDGIKTEKDKITSDLNGVVVELNENIRVLQVEISGLEEKRAELLRPLDDTPEKITENLAVTENLLDYLTGRKKELATARKTLSDSQNLAEKKLEDLLEKENWLGEREIKINQRSTALEVQEEALAKSVSSFTTDANKRNIELMLFEDKLNKKEVEIAEREKLVAQGYETIAKERKHIESQQQSLITAIAEAKQNNQI